MKTFKQHLSILYCVLMISTVSPAQNIFTPSGGIDGGSQNGNSVGIGRDPDTDCWTPLEIKSTDDNQQFTTGGWGRSITLFPDNQNNTSTIIWERGDCKDCLNNFFIGGPSIVPEGDYWVGLADGLCEDANADYITRYYATDDGSNFMTVPQGSTQFFHNLLVHEERNPRFAVGTLWPRQRAHINNGSLLLTGFGNDGNILFSDQNDDSQDTYFGNWGIQYYGPGTLGGNDPGGLNFWTPSGSNAGFQNNRLYLSDRNGNVGVNTFDPHNQLEITSDGNDPSPSGLRFTNLTSASGAVAGNGKVLGLNGSGDVIYVNDGGVTNSCGTTNMVPVITGANTLGCSIIWDNGTSVGISTTSPRTFNSSTSYASVTGGPANGTIAKLDVNGLTFTNSLVVSSDKRFKKNIEPLKSALDKITKLNGVSYDWKQQEFAERNFDNTSQIGFLAQDVAKIIPEAVMIDQDGFYALNYNMIIPVLAEAIKELDEKTKELASVKDELTKMKEKQSQFETDLSLCCSSYETKASATSTDEKATLQQNVPNPFTEKTKISFYIPEQSGNSFIKIYSLDGTLVRTFEISTHGFGQVTIEGNELTAGTYVYHLLIGGKQIDSKLMTLTK